MNRLEMRYMVFKTLPVVDGAKASFGDVVSAELVPPVPGEPLKMIVRTVDVSGAVRTHEISFSEID